MPRKRDRKSSSSIASGSWSTSQSPRCMSLPHHDLVRGRQEQRLRVEANDLPSGADAHLVAEVVLEEQHLVDAIDALDTGEQLEQRRRVEVAVERPTGALGPT